MVGGDGGVVVVAVEVPLAPTPGGGTGNWR
jgi:hypothetical protein